MHPTSPKKYLKTTILKLYCQRAPSWVAVYFSQNSSQTNTLASWSQNDLSTDFLIVSLIFNFITWCFNLSRHNFGPWRFSKLFTNLLSRVNRGQWGLHATRTWDNNPRAKEPSEHFKQQARISGNISKTHPIPTLSQYPDFFSIFICEEFCCLFFH